jgi:anti-anti-sigma factor
MNITISRTEKPTRITILHLEGKLDRANYESLIEEAREVYDEGVRDLILDLSKLTFISSAGMAALHQVALLYRGEKHPVQYGIRAVNRAIVRGRESYTQEHVKLLSPTREVREELNLTGFGTLFEIYTDLPKAVASFHQRALVMEAR